MPRTAWGWQITPEELSAWIIRRDDDLLVVNKPGLVVCHPSKHGPWSSLIGACREYLGAETLHMPSRLDRETSGVMVFARTRELGSLLQKAVQSRQVRKSYVAILEGELRDPVWANQPIGRALESRVYLRQGVRPDGQAAKTFFEPLEWRGGYTLARVTTETGRLHQIRVHAAWLGHCVVADKIYGPDEGLFLEFIEHGFSARLQAALPLERQALHADEMRFEFGDGPMEFRAPLAADMAEFWRRLGCS
jgi:23S rRNA pseudouridine1911/1915/1917 synthase